MSVTSGFRLAVLLVFGFAMDAVAKAIVTAAALLPEVGPLIAAFATPKRPAGECFIEIQTLMEFLNGLCDDVPDDLQDLDGEYHVHLSDLAYENIVLI